VSPTLFALERYEPARGGGVTWTGLSGDRITVVAVVLLAADDVVVALVEAPDEAAALAAASAAGWQVDRINPAVRLDHPSEEAP
jgi:hypothetical protein